MAVDNAILIFSLLIIFMPGTDVFLKTLHLSFDDYLSVLHTLNKLNIHTYNVKPY